MDPFTILAIMTAVSGGVSAYGQVQAGKAQKVAIERASQAGRA